MSWAEPGSERKADRKADRRPERYYSRGARQLLGSGSLPARPRPPGPEGGLAPVHFIPVPTCAEEEGAGQPGPQGTSWVNPLGVYDPSTSLWLQGKGPAEHEKQQEAGPPGTAGDGGACSQLASRVEDFNRRLREKPSDTPTWLEFVRFQVSSPRPASYRPLADASRQRLSSKLGSSCEKCIRPVIHNLLHCTE